MSTLERLSYRLADLGLMMWVIMILSTRQHFRASYCRFLLLMQFAHLHINQLVVDRHHTRLQFAIKIANRDVAQDTHRLMLSPVTWLNDIAEKLSVQRGYKPYPHLDTQRYTIHERIHESSSLVHLHLAWKGSVEIVSSQWKDFICWRGQTMSTSTDLSHTICYINKSQPSNLFPLL